MTVDEMRADFIARRKGSLSLPIAGVVPYVIAAHMPQAHETDEQSRFLSALLKGDNRLAFQGETR